MVNRLAAEKSPYLLQHADNPVDWFPWGPEAFDEARRRDVPVFVSVGYSSCHWCHVMAHESFEDDDVAALLNERFVSVKVDREERPDVDAVYMSAVQALTGHGGWPMSVFTTPDGKPFYAGTYWPRESRQGLVGFPQVATAVADAWAERREEVLGSADEIAVALSQRQEGAAGETLDLAVSDEAANLLLEAAWDRELGGFVSGGARLPEARRAPKFPQAMTIEYLLARHARTGEDDVLTPATHSLDAMARGGIHDQVGGGFARYSTDARWLVPHFEKMLYDNALLLSAYATAHALTGEDGFGRVARSTADYLLREMRHPEGGFYSATDADSEGVEGKFFVWSDGELREVLSSAGLDADRFARFFGVTAAGNFSPEHPGLTHDGGANILHEPVPRHVFADAEGLGREVFAAEVERAREALYARRGQRVPPGLDDKVLTSWNALVVRGLARAGAYLDEPRYLDAARDTAEFLATHLVVDGHLRHTYKEGTATVPAFLEDVALLAGALLELFELDGELRWFEWARELAEDAVARFHDDEAGAYFQTATDAESLYHRPKETWDNAQPSGNSALAEVFAKLAGLTGESRWHERAEEILRLLQDGMRKAPPGYGHALQVVERLLAGPRELAIVGRPGPARDALAAVAQRRPLPGAVVAVAAPGSDAVERVPLLHARTEVDGRPAAYVCRNLSCDRPVTTPDELGDALAGALEGS